MAGEGGSRTRFAKAHGLGNDFLLVAEADAPAQPAQWARRLCDRHLGVGADGVVLHRPAPDGVHMRLINADGGEAEISANGLRCLAAYMVWSGARPSAHVVYTGAGPRPVEATALGATRYRIRTDLGEAILDSARIPVALDPPVPRVVDHALGVDGETVRVTATSLGNPHCAVFLEQPAEDALLGRLGPLLERHPFFPRRTNVEFVTVVSPSELRVRFWERGVGYTRASGTGAASAAVAAMVKGLVERRLRVVCDGGTLEVEWPEGGLVRQVGEVEILFEGDWLA
ncbi:MAG TPA: diaminopimelate epimerase [Vicinamibacteria bacterium]|nr:diaminopimelate epimerase [Vicinamibacteria bacterium]